MNGKKERLQSIREFAWRTFLASAVGGSVPAILILRHMKEMVPDPAPPGAVIDLDEDNKMLLRDYRGRPIFVNLFGSADPQEMRLRVSVITEGDMPGRFFDSIGTVEDPASQEETRLQRREMRLVDGQTLGVIHDFFHDFERLTGIPIEVVENAEDADLFIGGFSRPDAGVAGFASYPPLLNLPSAIPFHDAPPQYMMLNMDYIQRMYAQDNRDAVLALVSHEFGHNLGLMHTHEKQWVGTGMSKEQTYAVARMSYNHLVFPPIAVTDIQSGFGPLELNIIRDALRELGYEPPPIGEGDNRYVLAELAGIQSGLARGRGVELRTMPALSLLDNGGHNALVGSEGDDLLVTESGLCGLINRQEREIYLLRDGQPYCLVEGEFSVVRSGAGDDLILTANGTEQTVYLGTGRKDVALVHGQVGEKTIHAGAEENEVTLTLHYSLLRNSDLVAERDGDDLRIRFLAPSGREVGRITLLDQTIGQGIDYLRVIDDHGRTMGSAYDLRGVSDTGIWQEHVLAPLQQIAQQALMSGLWADVAQARQGLAGEAGHWTAQSPREEDAGAAQDALPAPASHREAVEGRRSRNGPPARG